MYRLWNVVTRPILEAFRPSHIVEIGSEFGYQTELLLEFCRSHRATLTVIDPLPQFDREAWRETNAGVGTLIEALSLDALPNINEYDAILIDGDHNWYTVYHELKLVAAQAQRRGTWPLILFHDASWPYGRRDMYYNPETIPEAERRPFERSGMIPGVKGTTNEGINGKISNAVEEGGPRNGVLTAVEDFQRDHAEALELITLPGLSGVGILVSSELLAQNALLRDVIDGMRISSRSRELVEVTEHHRWKAELAANHAGRRLARRTKEVETLQERVVSLRADCKRLQVQVNAAELESTRLKGQLTNLSAKHDALATLASQLLVHRIEAEKSELLALKDILNAQLLLIQQVLVSRRIKVGLALLQGTGGLFGRPGIDVESARLRLLSVQQAALILAEDLMPRVIKGGEVLRSFTPDPQSTSQYFDWANAINLRMHTTIEASSALLREMFLSRAYWLGDVLVRRIGHRLVFKSIDEREWGPAYAATLESAFRRFRHSTQAAGRGDTSISTPKTHYETTHQVSIERVAKRASF